MRNAILISLLATLGACAFAMGPPMQTFDNVSILRGPDIPSLALGEFKPAPSLPQGADKAITVRTSSLNAPGGSLSAYLRESMQAELVAAGKLDPASSMAVSAQLTQSKLDSNPPTGHGLIAARFRVTRSGAILLDKEITAHDEWDSSFLGLQAIPEAMNRYTALYPKLVTALLSDPAFRAAVSAPRAGPTTP